MEESAFPEEPFLESVGLMNLEYEKNIWQSLVTTSQARKVAVAILLS